MQPRPATKHDREAFIAFARRLEIEVFHHDKPIEVAYFPSEDARAMGQVLGTLVSPASMLASSPQAKGFPRIAVDFNSVRWLNDVVGLLGTLALDSEERMQPGAASRSATHVGNAFALFALDMYAEADDERAFLASKAGA
jgi:hypothetical protein